jgi:hypothetical protein
MLKVWTYVSKLFCKVYDIQLTPLYSLAHSHFIFLLRVNLSS